jgi:hypothetical protein
MPEYRVTVPTQNLAGSGADVRSRLQTWEWRTRLPPWADSVAIDFSATRFIEPWALALFTAYALRMREELPISLDRHRQSDIA